MPPLIAPSMRRAAIIAIVLGAALTTALAVIVFHGASTSFDADIGNWLYRHLGPGWQVNLLGFSEPPISFALLAMIVVLAALHRRWNVVAFAVIGPLLALGITELALKPLIDRDIGSSAIHLLGSYPSGHETGVTATAIVILVVCGQLSTSRPARAALAIGLLAWAVIAAIGLVRGFLHYTTDTIGALGVSTVAVLGTALVLDRFSSPAARTPASTSRAA